MEARFEILSSVLVKRDNGSYACAHGAMLGLAEMMFAKLDPRDQKHFQSVLDNLIKANKE